MLSAIIDSSYYAPLLAVRESTESLFLFSPETELPAPEGQSRQWKRDGDVDPKFERKLQSLCFCTENKERELHYRLLVEN